MSQDVSELTPKQQRAIEALVQGKTNQEAAAAAGVNRKTITRWLQQPEFQTALRTAQHAAYDEAMADLAATSRLAVQRLRKLLNSSKTSEQGIISAARLVLDGAFRGHEQAEMKRQLQEIERMLDDDEPSDPN